MASTRIEVAIPGTHEEAEAPYTIKEGHHLITALAVEVVVAVTTALHPTTTTATVAAPEEASAAPTVNPIEISTDPPLGMDRATVETRGAIMGMVTTMLRRRPTTTTTKTITTTIRRGNESDNLDSISYLCMEFSNTAPFLGWRLFGWN